MNYTTHSLPNLTFLGNSLKSSDMSDVEGDDVFQAPGAAAGGPMDVSFTLQEVLKAALINDGLARVLHDTVTSVPRPLTKRTAHLCVLANNGDELMYVKLVAALCAEHGINLIKVDDNQKLDEWAGLCKIDKDGKASKVVGCSCVVVKDYGKEYQAHDVLHDYFKSRK